MRRRTPGSPPRIRSLTGLVALGLSAGLALVGCGAGSTHSTKASVSGGSYPVTVGGVRLDQRPKRIISLSPSATEMLFGIGAGGQVIAVDDQSNYPAGVPKSTLSGYKPDAEAIAAMNPDLVVISDDTNNIKEQLAKLKIPVYVTAAAKTLDDTYTQLADLGRLTGQVAGATNEVTTIKNGVAKLVADTPKPARQLTYYYELDPTLYSVTSQTFIGSLFGKFGLVSVADSGGGNGAYPQLSAESIVKANPDMIFLADTKCCQQSPTTVRARPGWSNLTAVAKGQVYPLDDDIASRWGPRVVDLVRAISDALTKVSKT